MLNVPPLLRSHKKHSQTQPVPLSSRGFHEASSGIRGAGLYGRAGDGRIFWVAAAVSFFRIARHCSRRSDAAPGASVVDLATDFSYGLDQSHLAHRAAVAARFA